MDKILVGNPSKSEVIGRDKKHRTDKSWMPKKISLKNPTSLYIKFVLSQLELYCNE